MAPHSSTVAQKIPWMEEPGGLQSMGSRRVRHNWVTSLSLSTFMHWRRKWQPTPVILPGESHGQRSLVGCSPWGLTELDTTEATWQLGRVTCLIVICSLAEVSPTINWLYWALGLNFGCTWKSPAELLKIKTDLEYGLRTRVLRAPWVILMAAKVVAILEAFPVSSFLYPWLYLVPSTSWTLGNQSISSRLTSSPSCCSSLQIQIKLSLPFYSLWNKTSLQNLPSILLFISLSQAGSPALALLLEIGTCLEKPVFHKAPRW